MNSWSGFLYVCDHIRQDVYTWIASLKIYTKEFAYFEHYTHGKSRMYFSKVTIDVDRGWPISFKQLG